ncbi:hypothetical protein AcV7_006738 [Taiwanofungus camphoratus]|nr:hypothetical protein AcV7_006738 [Antrodia cinnamomea]
MSSDFAVKAGRKLFEKHLHQYEPADPYYETYTDKRGRQRRRKRELPPGLSSHDAKILRSVKKRAHYLDKGFNICGMRFGWTFVIGMVPGAGDIADATLNYVLVVRKAQQANIPPWLLRRMLANNAVSVVVGLVPLAGDIVLAVFKANSRNAALLEEFLRIRGEESLKAEAERQGRAPQDITLTPGTGEMGERTPGKKDAGAGWFARRGKGKERVPRPSEDRGRFVEDVQSGTSGESQVHQ